MILYRVSLQTGVVRVHRIDALDPRYTEQADETLQGFGPIPGRAPFRVDVFPSMFAVFRGREHLVTCGVGKGRDALWSVMTGLQELQGEAARPSPPKEAHWLAVVEYPGLLQLAPVDRVWLAGFECAMAAALMRRKA